MGPVGRKTFLLAVAREMCTNLTRLGSRVTHAGGERDDTGWPGPD